WCTGRPIISQPWLGVAFGRLHRQLHAVRAPHGLRSNWIGWPAAADAAVVERLASAHLQPDRLLHLDCHPLNVLGARHRLTALVGVGILLARVSADGAPWLSAAGWLFVAGTVLFSGSLYLLALTDTPWLGAITPLGGIALLLGWLALAIGVWR